MELQIPFLQSRALEAAALSSLVILRNKQVRGRRAQIRDVLRMCIALSHPSPKETPQMAGRPFLESGRACVQPLTCPWCPPSTLLGARPLSGLRDGSCCCLGLQLPNRGASGLHDLL